MAIEAGAKNGIIEPDETTLAYVKGHNKYARPYQAYSSDADAFYSKVYEWDVTFLEPQVAFPHLPENSRNLSEAGL